jgi:hypothetical protein
MQGYKAELSTMRELPRSAAAHFCFERPLGALASRRVYRATPVSRDLESLSPPIRIFQNDTAPVIVDNSPFFDLFQGSKAADADEVVVQAAIAYARGFGEAVGIDH